MTGSPGSSRWMPAGAATYSDIAAERCIECTLRLLVANCQFINFENIVQICDAGVPASAGGCPPAERCIECTLRLLAVHRMHPTAAAE
jgi:hypothetical protein